jgi:hypothetical protein
VARRLTRLERALTRRAGPQDPTGRFLASLFATLIAYHLGELQPDVEPAAHGYARALGYGPPRDLLAAMIKRPEDHAERDKEARVRLLATVGVDLQSADFGAIAGGLERLLEAMPASLRLRFAGTA